MNLIEERTIALAAVVQACRQVQLLAREGQSHQADTEPLKQSILILDAVSTPAVYGGLAGVKTGLKMIGDGLLGSPQGENVEILRYTMSLLHLQTQLYRDSDSFQKFGQAIERLSGECGNKKMAVDSRFCGNVRVCKMPRMLYCNKSPFIELN